MGLDTAALQALWALSDAGGPRVEYSLPVLYAESSFDSTVINSIGCVGLNQACSGFLNSLGVDAATYASWPASEQIRRGFAPYMLGYSPLKSGVRVYQANYLPATLKTATALSDVITASPSPYYNDNKGFDTAGKGYITLQDLADSVARAAAHPAVQNAIAAAYALRPGESPSDPVYGTDFLHPVTKGVLIALGIIGVSGAIAYTIHAGYLDKALAAVEAKFETSPRRRRLAR
jgi:hypothetical protein